MKIACVTTTVNVPHVLALYAKHDPDVTFFVIGDRKTNDMHVVEFLTDHVPNHAYYGIDMQHSMYPKLSHLIGENCIQRRNIGFLEALKWGADVIVSIDDDNISLSGDYFDRMVYPLSPNQVFDGVVASSATGWFDVGTLLQPKAEHRGFPHTKRATPVFEAVTDAHIGVAAGICMGDPDIGAVERIANGPTVHGVSELLRSGIVIDPRKTWTVFNSQNTAVIRELVPAWFMLPHVGRYDDIFASLIVQRIMRVTGHVTHFGAPFVWQQRNQHDFVKDLKQEIDGMEHIVHLAGILDRIGKFYADERPAKTIFKRLSTIEWFPKRATEAALAWCDEIEKAM